jgi:DNA primase
MAWYPREGSKFVVLVEDCYSGLRLWQEGITAVALLGTNLNDERVQEIVRGSKGATVAVALDEDAYKRSILHVLRYRNQVRMRLIRLKKDVKDMNEIEMQAFVLGLV